MRGGQGLKQIAVEWTVGGLRSEFPLSASTPMVAGVREERESAPVGTDLHAGIEVGITLSGRCERYFESCVIPGRPGDVWLCGMWEPHGWRFIAPRTESVVVVFLPVFLGEEMLGGVSWLTLLAVPPSERPQVRTRAMREAALAIGFELAREIREKPAGWETMVRLDLLRLLLQLTRGWHPESLQDGRRRSYAAALRRVLPALSLLHERRPASMSLGEAAGACDLSRSRFAVLFREAMGVSFRQFRLRARLSFAAHLLRTTELCTEEIASAAGFADASHLHRAFVRHYHQTPGQARRGLR